MMPKSLKRLLIAVWVAGALAVCGVTAAAWLMRDSNAGHQLPSGRKILGGDSNRQTLESFFETPAFALTDQDGKPFASTVLAGKVWIADFVFTRCTSMCPIMTQNMRDIQKATQSMPAGPSHDSPAGPVQLVSFTVDPENDTPAVLKEYARINKADESRWHFLTGDRQTIWNLSTGMKLAVGQGDSAMEVMHSSRFLLIDGKGTVRGIYDYKDAGAIQKLLEDTKTLLVAGGK